MDGFRIKVVSVENRAWLDCICRSNIDRDWENAVEGKGINGIVEAGGL
jgi:hypothetical protein